MQTEKLLVKECIAGNRAMQSELYKMFSPQMFVVCMRYAKNRNEAKEILQEGFIKVFTFLHQYNFKSPLEAWIRRIMVNCALQKMKSRQMLYHVVNVDDVEQSFCSEDFIPANILEKELMEMIHELPVMCRLVFNLYVFENLKHKEIAALLNVTEGTSKSNLHDARKLLQKKFSYLNAYANSTHGA